MTTSRIFRLRSFLVLVVAVVLLELITAGQYYATRKGITEELTEMAQRDLNASSHAAQLKEKVEQALAEVMPDLQRFTANEDKDSLKLVIREMLGNQPQVVGAGYCRFVGSDGVRDGLYIFKDEEEGGFSERVVDFDYTQHPLYLKAIDSDHFWSEPYMSSYSVKLMCTFARAVRDAQGKPLGMITADVPLEELSALATKLFDNQNRTMLPVILLQLLGLGILVFIVHRYVRGLRRLHQVNTDKERIMSQLSIARGIQEAMQPKVFPPYSQHCDIDIYATLTPAWEVGGDFCDYIIRDEKLFICIGDVSGKGVPAALVMAVARSSFRLLTGRESAPDRIITAMNEMMAQDNDFNMFVTMFVGVLDLPTGRLHYTNAGHNPPYVNGQRLPVDPNLPVGIISNFRYSVQELEIPSGSTIFLYTDGLTEAEDAKHNQFGHTRLQAHLKAGNVRQLIEEMTASVNEFVGETEQSDDLTMVAIHYVHHSSDTLLTRSLTLPCEVSEISRLSEMVEEVCEEVGFPLPVIQQVNLALEEAVVNVMRYAYPMGQEGDVTIEAVANAERLKFVVIDSGKPFDPTTREQVDTTLPLEERPIGGLGIHLIRRFMDSINYERRDGRNILTLRKKIQPTE